MYLVQRRSKNKSYRNYNKQGMVVDVETTTKVLNKSGNFHVTPLKTVIIIIRNNNPFFQLL